MHEFRRIGVYCGASASAAPQYYEAARSLGELLGRENIGLVYGGGSTGMMGAVADGVLEAGGEVLGVIPRKLMELEVDHKGATEMFVVDSMHARKAMMMTLSDGFITMPGGYGTLEELFEVVTWSQLNYHMKPNVIFDIDGYYEHLAKFLDHAAEVGFVRPNLRSLVQRETTAEGVLACLRRTEVPAMSTWFTPR